MRVPITGATGTIGGAILKQCLANPSITSIIALSRRQLPTSHPKLSTIIVSNFAIWDSNLLSQIVSADAAIWAMGTTDANHDVNYIYPHIFLESFISARKTSPYVQKRFRFIRICGAFTERDQNARLWYYAEPRKLHGLSEARTLELAEQYRDVCQIFVLKPGGVLQAGSWVLCLGEYLLGDGTVISDEKLGAFAADLVVHGEEEEGAILNKKMVKKGTALLSHSAK